MYLIATIFHEEELPGIMDHAHRWMVYEEPLIATAMPRYLAPFTKRASILFAQLM